MRTFICILFFFASGPVTGTHLMGGYISYQSTQGMEVEVTVHLLTDADGVTPGLGQLSFGDGTSVTGLSDPTIVRLGFNIDLLSYTSRHTYISSGLYKISYREANYSGGINNLNNSSDIPFYISSSLVIDPSIQLNRAPVLMLFQAQRGASGVTQKINPAPFDPDDDSLSFELIVPGKDQNLNLGYLYPNDSVFYEDYSMGNASGDAPPVFSINAASGEITWNAPGMSGAYVISFEITQWRKSGGKWNNIGLTEVVMMDHVFDALHEVLIHSPESQCYEKVEQIEAQFVLNSLNSDPVTAKIFTNLPEGEINGVTVNGGGVIEFSFSGELVLNLSLSESLTLEPFKLYRIVIQVESSSLLQASSWVFAIGCADLPGELLPKPIVPVEVEKGYLVYPNPTFYNFVNVRLPKNAEKLREIRIFNMKGQVLLSRKNYFSEEVLHFELAGLSPGIYIIQVDEFVQKFIVLR